MSRLHGFAAAVVLTTVLGATRLCAQSAVPTRGMYDSITVTTLSFPGAEHVGVDDLRRTLFTRPSPCRLPFLVAVCKVSASQIFTDRRRTTTAALGEDMTKLRVYLWIRGYHEARVDTVLTAGGRGTAVKFIINEGPPTLVSALSVSETTPILGQSAIDELVQLKAGAPLDYVALDSTLAYLRAAYWNKGYADIRIDTTVPRADASRLVPVRISVDPRWPSRVGSVRFEGNTYLSQETLRRGIVLSPGSVYTRDAVLESQKRLFALPAISRAVVITPPAGDSVKQITIAVSEVDAHQASVTVGFNTIEFAQAAVELRDNTLGSGRWLSLRGAASNLLAEQLDGSALFRRSLPGDVTPETRVFLQPTYQASLTLTQPWIGSARTSAALTAFAGRRSLANVVVDEDAGGSIGIVHDLAPRIPIGVNYRLETTRVQGSAVYFCAGYGICDPATRKALTSRQRLAPVGVSGWIDRADDLEVPTSGYTAVVDAEHASSVTGSTFAHNRISADGSYYHAVGSSAAGTPKVFALHLRGGYVRPLSSDRSLLGLNSEGEGVLHPRARFYAGGMQSVRGFSENELGPTVLQVRRTSLIAAGCTATSIANGSCDASVLPSDQFFARPVGGSSVIEASTELRLPLLKALGAVVFLDGAYVGTSGLLSPAKGHGAVTPGAGFRYNSPLGILRLDIGIRPLGAQSLPVVVDVIDPNGDDHIVQLAKEKLYSPVDPSPGALRTFARRLVVHFALGQAF